MLFRRLLFGDGIVSVRKEESSSKNYLSHFRLSRQPLAAAVFLRAEGGLSKYLTHPSLSQNPDPLPTGGSPMVEKEPKHDCKPQNEK
jgi:hypothetical protein